MVERLYIYVDIAIVMMVVIGVACFAIGYLSNSDYDVGYETCLENENLYGVGLKDCYEKYSIVVWRYDACVEYLWLKTNITSEEFSKIINTSTKCLEK